MDVGTPTLTRKSSISAASSEDPRAAEVLALVGEHTPSTSNSPLASYLPGFTSLRLLLMKTNKTPRETEVLGTILGSYSSYVSAGKPTNEIAWLLARDCMHLSQPQVVPQQQRQHIPLQGLAAPPQPPVQGNGSVLHPGAPAIQPTTGIQSIQGMALPSARQLHPGHQFAMSESQPFQGSGQPSASAVNRQNGQHSSSNGSNGTAFGMK